MGCVFSCEDTTQIPKDSPLGLILKNWQRLMGKGTFLSEVELIRLSGQVWPTYKSEKNKTWPKFGSLDEELVLNLMSCIGQDQYLEELKYAKLFVLLLHDEELQRSKKKQHVMLLRRKGKKDEREEPVLSPSCVRDKEEVEIDLVAPSLRAGLPAVVGPPPLPLSPSPPLPGSDWERGCGFGDTPTDKKGRGVKRGFL